MRNTLQDQLLKAGLINEKSLKQSKKEQKPLQKQPKNQRHIESNATKLQAQQNLRDKIKHDREISQQLKAQTLQREIVAQIRQMIEQNRQSRGDGHIPYNFADNKTIKKILVSQIISDQLKRGQLAIVKLDDKYELIPARAAAKISERDATCVIVCNSPASSSVSDDPYATYQIPDDLMW